MKRALCLPLLLALACLPASAIAQCDQVVLWNKLGSLSEIANSEVGPGIEQRSYIYSDWQEAMIVPAQFGDGLFVNHDTGEGWARNGGNFFAADISQTGLSPERGSIEFWFQFEYAASTHNHAYFLITSDTLTNHFPNSSYGTYGNNLGLVASWNGWDYGSYGKRFISGLGSALGSSYVFTADFSAAPGGALGFTVGTRRHFAMVWDIAGIDGSADKLRLYVDGNVEASTTATWPTANALRNYLYIGSYPNYGSWDHYYNAVKGVTDNLVIWSCARTDFSHRFVETPPAGSISELVQAANGGTVAMPDGGLSIDIDAGDLPTDTAISVTRTVATDPEVDLTLGTNPALGKAVAIYDLGPDGLELTSSVTLTLIADVTSLNANQRSRLDLYLLTDTDGDGSEDSFVPLGASCDVVEDSGVFLATCSAEIDHFSTFSMIAPLDTDDDGVADLFGDEADNCPHDPNPGQEEVCDDDGIGDVCDPDADGDEDPATSDCNDCDPTIYSGAVENCTDGVDNNCNGQIDEQAVGADCDADTVPNELDNCPLDYNTYQEDLDGDGLGDVCDDDIDGDGVGNDSDNCPVNANPGQEDFDADGAGDACDEDADADGLVDATEDLCLWTTTDPAAGVPSKSLGKNRWAEMDGNAQFDTNGNNPTGRMYSIYTTAGCNCAQIIAACGYGQGHFKFGCSHSVMDWWTGLYDRAGEAPFQCKSD